MCRISHCDRCDDRTINEPEPCGAIYCDDCGFAVEADRQMQAECDATWEAADLC